MKNIESTIVELGGIFSQLAHMVKEQEEMVQRYVSYSMLYIQYVIHTVLFMCLVYSSTPQSVIVAHSAME